MKNEYDILAEKHRRLRVVAERVVESGTYPVDDGDEQRVYASQLRALKRELNGVPQPSAFATMGA